MASKIDMSLDDLVKLKRQKKGGAQTGQQQQPNQRGGGGAKRGAQRGGRQLQRGGRQFQRGGRQFQRGGRLLQRGGRQFQRGGRPLQRGGQQRSQQQGSNVTDLREVLAKKQKSSVTDLRAKLTAKSPGIQRGMPSTRGRGGGGRQRSKTYPQPRSHSPPMSSLRRGGNLDFSESISQRHTRESPVNLPSYSEAKKITVTIPGLSRPMAESYKPTGYRREERLAAAIARSKEARQDSYLRNREEFVASTITSAFGGAPVTNERDRAAMGGGYPRVQMRGFSRSPSPVPDLSYESQFAAPRASLQSRPSKGLTTVTSMIISNLSDTVSKNDVAELCSAVGLVDAIYITAPGVAEVVFKYKDDALEAYKKYNQRNLDGQPMICKLQATSRTRVSVGGYGGRGVSDTYTDDFYPSSSGFY